MVSRLWPVLAAGLSLLVVAAQCSSSLLPETPPPAQPTAVIESPPPVDAPAANESEAKDLLAAVRERGYLKVAVRVWPEAAFSPPVFRHVFGALDGYEVAVAHLLADELGVGLEMSEADPRLIQAGDWQGEWDIALAWLPVTDESAQVLLFSDPYAIDRGAIVVNANAPAAQSMDDLASKTIGAPADTIYFRLLSGQAVSRDGQFVAFPLPPDVTVQPYRHDGAALQDLTAESPVLDAVFHSQYMLEAAQTELPITFIATGLPPVEIGAAFDRSGLPAERLRVEINVASQTARNDGRLSQFAGKWYSQDVSK